MKDEGADEGRRVAALRAASTHLQKAYYTQDHHSM